MGVWKEEIVIRGDKRFAAKRYRPDLGETGGAPLHVLHELKAGEEWPPSKAKPAATDSNPKPRATTVEEIMDLPQPWNKAEREIVWAEVRRVQAEQRNG